MKLSLTEKENIEEGADFIKEEQEFSLNTKI